MSLRDLNTEVTQAILEAEGLEHYDLASPNTMAAWAKVSEVEEQLGDRAETATERNIARRGSITAALKAGDANRARALLYRYEDNPEFDKKSNQEMRDVITNPNLLYAHE